jgi:acetyltransferase
VVTCAKAFALPPLRGDRLVVASMSGGMSVIAADACSRHGFVLPPLPRALLRDLEQRGRGGVIHLQNPLDLGDIHDPAAAVEALTRILPLSEVDGAAVCLPSPASAGRVLGGAGALEALVERLREAGEACAKPVALSFFAGRRTLEALRGRLGLPVFADLPESIEALAFQRAYWRARGRPPATAFAAPTPTRRRFPEALRQCGPTPPFPAVLAFLEAEGLPVEPARPVRSAEEAAAVARLLGGPVALKVVAPGLLHKSDAGGVALGLAPEEVPDAAGRLLARVRGAAPDVAIQGLVVQRMRGPGHEVMIGARRDPAFGPVVIFGLGGVWVEVLEDVSLRLAPVDRAEAREMVQEIRGATVLAGARGRPPAALDAVADLVVAVSRLAAEFPELRELDLNPVVVTPREATIVDARLVLEPA